MITLLILIAALVGLAQFSVSYWRSMLASTAAKPLSERFCNAIKLEKGKPSAADFSDILSLHRLTPGLDNRPSRLRGLQAYYSTMGTLRRLPALNKWAQSEMTTCARYLAVIVDQRLSNNLACAAEMRSC
jgi:hypothetical protein